MELFVFFCCFFMSPTPILQRGYCLVLVNTGIDLDGNQVSRLFIYI